MKSVSRGFSRRSPAIWSSMKENFALAGRLIQQSCLKHGVQPQILTLHSDRGSPMTSQCTAQLLADLGVTRSLSRPNHLSDGSKSIPVHGFSKSRVLTPLCCEKVSCGSLPNAFAPLFRGLLPSGSQQENGRFHTRTDLSIQELNEQMTEEVNPDGS